jgi:TolB-like protein/Tfp pilus assembly protein PilF
MPIYEFENFRLDSTERHLRHRGQPVPLTAKHLDLLLLLVRNSGRLVSKEELIAGVWSEQFVGDYNLTVAISALRKMLDAKAGGQRLIETVSRHGYRFAARVREVERPVAPEPGSRPKAAGVSLKSIAVLPFVNDVNDPVLEYLPDGIAEGIINDLSQLPPLKVMARGTTFRYRGRDVDVRKVARKLGVEAVLTGRVLKVGKSIVICIELIDATDGSQVWGEQYKRSLSNILAVQKQITREVAKSLRLKLSLEDEKLIEKRRTNSAEAYVSYLKGRYFWNKRTAGATKKSIEYFERALAADAGYALAYAGLADSYLTLGTFKVVPPVEAFRRAREAALNALALDDTLAEAHTSLAHIGMMDERDWGAIEREFRRAIELNPGSATTRHWFSVYLRVQGRFDEALVEMETALKLEPLSLVINAALGTHFHFARRPDRAIEQLSKTIELDANFPYAHFVLAQAYGQQGRYDEAIAEVRKASRLLGNNPEVLARLGCFLALSKRKGQARAILSKLKALKERKHVSSYDIAIIHAGLGEPDQAFEWLEVAFADHDETVGLMGIDPLLDSLRPDPRFADLLRRAGLPAAPPSNGTERRRS